MHGGGRSSRLTSFRSFRDGVPPFHLFGLLSRFKANSCDYYEHEDEHNYTTNYDYQHRVTRLRWHYVGEPGCRSTYRRVFLHI